MRPDTKKQLDAIVDCITCSDGGVSFSLFIQMIEMLDGRAQKGDAAAEKCIEVIRQFKRLLEVANTK